MDDGCNKNQPAQPPALLNSSMAASVHMEHPVGGEPHAEPLVYAPQACHRDAEQSHAVGPTTPARTTRGFTASLATLLLALFLLPAAHAQFVSACGTAPSGINNCPWYQVEIVIFRNDNARAVSVEDLAGTAKPRWSPRLATLLPPAGEEFVPMRTAEYLALWQSAGQAPEWVQVTPGLTVEQERALREAERLGRARRTIDLSHLGDQLAWVESDPDEGIPDDSTHDGDAEPTAEERPVPENEPVVELARPSPEQPPEDEFIEVPELIGVIPMDLAFREVPAGQRLLDGQAARLRRARGFEVLGQLAWRQPFATNEAGLAQLVYSADLAESGLAEGELLLGTLTVDLRRFLHAHLDLYFKASDSTPGNGSEVPSSSGEQTPHWIHVQQSRRMRSGELHYLDHPWVGAIIRIERYQAPSEG